jgi:tRNA-binding EMAP/Myf-like protein
VIVALNLGAKRIAGFTSQCLVLAAAGDDGRQAAAPEPEPRPATERQAARP